MYKNSTYDSKFCHEQDSFQDNCLEEDRHCLEIDIVVLNQAWEIDWALCYPVHEQEKKLLNNLRYTWKHQ